MVIGTGLHKVHQPRRAFEEPLQLTIKLKSESRKIDEIVVKARRGKYRRKDNPAVELMRRVIAAKKRTHLENHTELNVSVQPSWRSMLNLPSASLDTALCCPLYEALA